jgi:hypothetical protein
MDDDHPRCISASLTSSPSPKRRWKQALKIGSENAISCVVVLVSSGGSAIRFRQHKISTNTEGIGNGTVYFP